MDDVPVAELRLQLRLERGDRVLVDVDLVGGVVDVDLVGLLGLDLGRLVGVGVGVDLVRGLAGGRGLDRLDRRQGVVELGLGGTQTGLLRFLRHGRTCFLLRKVVLRTCAGGGARRAQPPKIQNVARPMPRSTTVTNAMTTATNTSTTAV